MTRPVTAPLTATSSVMARVADLAPTQPPPGPNSPAAADARPAGAHRSPDAGPTARTIGGVSAARILVVDDEAGIRELVGTYLRNEGFDVDEVADGESALERFATDSFDVIVLDLRLPGIGGFDVLREIRRTSDVYVIVLTARVEETDRLIGLELGADDYVTKPFSPRELTARVRAVLRRPRDPAVSGDDDIVRFAGLDIDVGRHEVRVDDAPVELTSLEFELLAALSSAPGRVFTRAQLIERVWGWDFYGDERIVDVHIRNLRRALGDPADRPRFIGTVRGVGYKSVAVPV
jgi:DNA-binding response OmpR family regulator